MKQFILARLRERSTWRGLVLIATAAGAKLSPDMQEAIITGGLALAGTLGVFLPDNSRGDVKTQVEEEVANRIAQAGQRRP